MLSPGSNSTLRFTTVLIAGLALFVMHDNASAQLLPDENAAPPVYTVRDIRVEGATSTSASAIVAFSGIRIGDEFTAGSELFAGAVRNLYQRRIFSDVKIFAEDFRENSLVVVIAVSEYSRVGSISVTGNDEYDDEDVLELLTVGTGDIADPSALKNSEEAIKAKYAEDGYLFSEVEITHTPSIDEPGRVDLLVSLSEGPEVSIGEVKIEGNDALDDGDVKGAMEDIKEKSWWQFWRSSKLERDKLKDDEGRIVDLYRSKGYIDAEVISDSIEIDARSGKSTVTITVSEGRKVYLRSIRMSGNTVYDSTLIRKLLGVELGEQYDQLTLEENLNGNGERSVRSLYLDNGYLTFNALKSEQRAGLDSVDVVIRMQEGSPAFIRFVDIVGNTKTKDEVIRRELYTIPGDKFSRAAIIRSLRNLAQLNYFNPERLVPDVRPSADATKVDVTYQVEERPSDTFNASMGLSSQGLTGAIGLSFTNFSITEPLFGGGGQILNLNAEFGSYVQTYSIGLTEPWLFGKPITLGANLFYQRQDLGTFSASDEFLIERFGVTTTVGARLKWPDDFFRGDVAFRFTRNNLIGSETQSSIYKNGTEFSIAPTLSRTSIDDQIFPSVGSRFRFSNIFAFGFDAQYTRHEASFDFYSRVAQVTESNRLVLYLNGEFGYLNDYGPRENIPPTVFYTMGGTSLSGLNTVQLRGYRDRSIGPVDQDGFPSGITSLKTTAELRFALSVNPIPIYTLLFAEAGNVWGSFSEVDPFNLRRSMGVGMRVMMPPIGLLGFDYGFGFDTDSFETTPTSGGTTSGWHFHFQFGR